MSKTTSASGSKKSAADSAQNASAARLAITVSWDSPQTYARTVPTPISRSSSQGPASSGPLATGLRRARTATQRGWSQGPRPSRHKQRTRQHIHSHLERMRPLAPMRHTPRRRKFGVRTATRDAKPEGLTSVSRVSEWHPLDDHLLHRCRTPRRAQPHSSLRTSARVAGAQCG